METKKDISIKQAKEVLSNAGYYVDNLWHVKDVINKYKDINKDEAYFILDEALTSERIQSEVFEAIEYFI